MRFILRQDAFSQFTSLGCPPAKKILLGSWADVSALFRVFIMRVLNLVRSWAHAGLPCIDCTTLSK